MLCSKFKKKIFAAVDNSDMLESNPKLKQHMTDCSKCRTFYDMLVFENRCLFDAGEAIDVPETLEESIAARLPENAITQRRRSWSKLAYATAACLIVLLIVLIYPQRRAAELVDLEGTIQVDTLFGWKNLSTGDAVRKNAVLRTLEDSKAKVLFPEGNYIRLEPESSIYLGARVHKQYDHIYRLEYGSIWAKVAHNYDGEFYIETPHALVIRVLGTEFNVRTVSEPKN